MQTTTSIQAAHNTAVHANTGRGGTPRAPARPPCQHDEAVVWFGESRRTVGGVPDSRYGWLPLSPEEGGPCIVKAMDPQLVAYNKTLLDHEWQMLKRLRAIGAPAPDLVNLGRDDWLVTRFAGLSLQRLEHSGGLQGLAPWARFPFQERMAAWIHLLRRMQPMADAGVLAMDVYGANVVVPLTEGTQGQLRLHEVTLIDHAYTLEPGMAMRRPAWLNRDMQRIAPELREALRQDQEALITAFAAAGAELPGYSRLPGDRDAHSRRVWAEYDAPQALQRLLDAGQIGRDQAMQYAAATAMGRLLTHTPQHMDRAALAQVLRRMTNDSPGLRYPTLTEAADALAQMLGAVPMVSEHRYAELSPGDLVTPDISTSKNDSKPVVIDLGQTALQADLATIVIDSVSQHSQATQTRSAADHAASEATPLVASAQWPERTRSPQGKHVARSSAVWIYAAAAFGAAAGIGLPLPW